MRGVEDGRVSWQQLGQVGAQQETVSWLLECRVSARLEANRNGRIPRRVVVGCATADCDDCDSRNDTTTNQEQGSRAAEDQGRREEASPKQNNQESRKSSETRPGGLLNRKSIAPGYPCPEMARERQSEAEEMVV